MNATQVLTTLAAIAIPIKGIVDAIRRHRPGLDGLTVQAIAVVLGSLGAWAIDFRATEALLNVGGIAAGRIPIAPVDYIITGVAIAASAGLFAELSGRSGSTPTIVEVDATGRHL